MRAAAVLSIALVCFFNVASSCLGAGTPVSGLSSNAATVVDDNSVFAAEQAMAVSEKTKLSEEAQQSRAAEGEVSRLRRLVSKNGASLVAAESLIRSKLGSQALDELRSQSENGAEAALQSQVNQELRMVAVELNSSGVALQSKTHSLNATMASLHSEESRRAAAENLSGVEARAIEQMHAKISAESVSLATAQTMLTKTSAQLRTARAQLHSATAVAATTHQSASEVQAELRASRAEAQGLKQKLGRVVEMVQSALANDDREASDGIAAEHSRGETARADLAAAQKEADDLRARSAEITKENEKLRVLVRTQRR